MKNRAWTPHCADSGEKDGTSQLFLGYAVMFSELILAPVTPSTRRVVRGLSIPSSVTCHRSSITTKRQQFAQHWLVHHVDGIVADCVTSAIFLTAMAPNLR